MRYLFCFIFIIQVINVYGQEQNISKQRQAQNEQQYLDSLINQYAPNFKAKTLNGEYFDLSKHKGKVILINFWSLSCVYFFKEIVDFNRIVEERKYDNFILVSLMDNSIEDLNKKIISNGDFYKLLKPIFENDLINFEIIPSSKEVMKKCKLG